VTRFKPVEVQGKIETNLKITKVHDASDLTKIHTSFFIDVAERTLGCHFKVSDTSEMS